MKKIVIASDSFKGSLSSTEVAKAAAAGIRSIYPSCEIICLGLGDGGEGTCEAIARTKSCKWVSAIVKDPIGRDHSAKYGLCTDAEGLTAVIEMSEASGIMLLTSNELNPLTTSTFGTGQIIMDAFERGCRRFIIGLGGSATNDGGTGMLEALGFRFQDNAGKLISRCCGHKLHEISSIDSSMVPEELLSSSFTIACDVETPFYGEYGATRVFAPQKGASDSDIENLEIGMQSFASVILRKYGIDLGKIKGSGAAGGTGGALHAFLHGKLSKGADLVLDGVRFEEAIENADMVITGEGRIDSQTFCGKLPYRVLSRAASVDVPVLAIGGIVELSDEEIHNSGFSGIIPIQPHPSSPGELAAAMNPTTTARNIQHTIASLLKTSDLY